MVSVAKTPDNFIPFTVVTDSVQWYLKVRLIL